MGVFGEKLTQLREAKNLSMGQLAELADTTRGHINNLEKGARSPSDRILIKLAPVLGVALSEMRAWRDADLIGEPELEKLNKPAQVVRGHGKPARRFMEAVTSDGTPVWVNSKHRPTDWELDIISKAEAAGITFAGLASPAFWDYPPEERASTFRHMEGMLDEVRRWNKWANETPEVVRAVPRA